VGAALATGVMVALPPRPLAIAFGLSLLLAVALSSVGWVLVPTRRNAVLAGVASGLMGTITSAGAPPLGLLTQRLPPPVIRATVGCIIAIGSVVSLVLLAGAGHFSQAQALLGLALFPWVLTGFQVCPAGSHDRCRWPAPAGSCSAWWPAARWRCWARR
jgi:uncharacterized membrane protein YfcA